jgi:hypothetical protein
LQCWYITLPTPTLRILSNPRQPRLPLRAKLENKGRVDDMEQYREFPALRENKVIMSRVAPLRYVHTSRDKKLTYEYYRKVERGCGDTVLSH